MREGHRDPVTVSSSLDAVVRSLRGPDRSTVSGLFGRWDDVVGDQVAAHVRPLKLDAGVLLVEVDDPAWATQVKFLAGTIIERLADVAGVRVDRIEARVHGVAGRRGAARRPAG
ncbi:MAG: DciA family protein [Ilumatobacteraceae bacterium]